MDDEYSIANSCSICKAGRMEVFGFSMFPCSAACAEPKEEEIGIVLFQAPCYNFFIEMCIERLFYGNSKNYPQ